MRQPRGDEPNKRPPPKVNPRSEWIPIDVPAIISQDLFDAAQRRLDAAPQLAFRNTKREYLIGRRVRCACGRAATGATSSLSGRNTKRYMYYSCNSRRGDKSSTAEPCDTPPFRADHADAAVWRWVRKELLTRDRLHRNIKRRDAARERQAKTNDPAAQRAAELEKLKQKRERLNHAYVSGVQSFEEYAPVKRDLDRAILELEAQPAPAPTYRPASAALLETLIDEYADEIDHADFALRRFILDRLDVRVVLHLVDGQKHLQVRANELDIEADIPLTV
jgi:hypothetical protein